MTLDPFFFSKTFKFNMEIKLNEIYTPEFTASAWDWRVFLKKDCSGNHTGFFLKVIVCFYYSNLFLQEHPFC
jgi:hypothetical protein